MTALSPDLFKYDDYKKYLADLSEFKGRGFRKAIAEAAQCQTAYISHVLGGNAHFSLEQAEAISRLVSHTELETLFFLTLIDYTRSGTPSLRKFLSGQLGRLRDRHQRLKDRFGIKSTVSQENQGTFFSHWSYTAVYFGLMLTNCKTANALSHRLGIGEENVKEILDFLCSVNLAVKNEDQYENGPAELHLGKENPAITRHHLNWRVRCLPSLDQYRKNSNMHYSMIFTVSEKDLEKVRNTIKQCVQETVETVRKTTPDRLYAFTLDLFNVDTK